MRQKLLLIYLWGAMTSVNMDESTQLVTDPRTPYRPETTPARTTPGVNSQDWIYNNKGGQYIGLLFAGRFEFNWIVDIRIERPAGITMRRTQELWSIGNLIASKRVLTTCRAISIFEASGKSVEEIKVYFASHYLWQNYESKSRLGDRFDVNGVRGMRQAADVKVHPKCSLDRMKWDVSVIELQDDILPLLPSLGYTPLSFNLSTGDVLKYESKRTPLCYVASFGRNYNNPQNPFINIHSLDFKVKYRVYITTLPVCVDAMKFMCEIGEHVFCEKNLKYQSHHCFEVKAKVGSVCDHDRGAPVVCDDLFIGIVIRGANYDHCNSLIHLPFIALGINPLRTYFENFKIPEEKSLGTSSMFCLSNLKVCILVLSSIIMCFANYR